MNKKFLGIRLGTILTVIGCIVAALAIWVLAKYRLEISMSRIDASSIISHFLL